VAIHIAKRPNEESVSKVTKKIVDKVTASVRAITRHQAYVNWLSTESPREDDLLVINNSFVFRDVKTTKSNFYIAQKFQANGQLKDPIYIAEAPQQNVDFQLISHRHQSPPNLIQLDDAIINQIKKSGNIVFSLIGFTVEDRTVELSLKNGPFERIIWNPKLNNDIEVFQNEIHVKDTTDEVSLWSSLITQCQAQNISIPVKLQQEFGEALDRLQGQAVVSLKLPKKNSYQKDGITDSIVKVLTQHKSDYKTVLQRYQRARQRADRAFNEVLRIAYGFASDATEFLRLIVSTCDLKPVVLWATLAEHLELSEALRDLPWTRSKHKPSLKNYIDCVGDARNRAFHNVFPFDKALNFSLPAGSLRDAELRFFSEYGARAHGNELTFEDKALVDVLLEFTRAKRRPVPQDFWSKNLRFMDAIIKLFSETSAVLKILYHES